MNVELPARATVASVSEVKGSLMHALRNSGDERIVVFNAHAVSSVDSAMLQLLFAFVRDAVVDEVEVQWTHVSDAMRSTAKLLGFEPEAFGWS
ncbi:MAG: STAS domain-containing protein [Gammaproteobacteria bacterium]|nr:STAS domain-containing protein [Gammaproteobacteria bacterium]